MQYNYQNSQPRAKTDDNFLGNRKPYGQRGHGRGNVPRDIHPENPHKYQRGCEIHHSEKSTESDIQHSRAEGQGIEGRPTSVNFEACSTIKLSKLLTRDENEVLFKLQTPSFGFAQRLQQGSSNQMMVQLLIEVIAKVCTSVHQTQLIDLLSKIQNSAFLKDEMLQYLNKFIMEDKMVEPEICSFIIRILRTLSRLFPSKSLPVLTLLCAPLQRILTIDTPDYDDANKEYTKLQEETTDVRKQLQSGIIQRDQERQVDWTVDESEDYRRMSVVPTSEDIRGQGDLYLRENKIYQEYKDTHDYLDVQFRLMKEDLVRPLREGLAELLQNREAGNNKRRTSNMKLYSRVQITSVLCSQHGLIYKIQFDVSGLRHIRWEAGKRLMFGSLVCLSADDFKNMLIATVAERDARDLRGGVTYLYIEEDGNRNKDLRQDQIYEMIESPAYYEPYKSVLEALQKFTYEEKLPFERYLLNKSGAENVPPPNYLTRNVKYDFSSLMHKVKVRFELAKLRERAQGPVTVLDLSTWPTAEELRFDESQYNALQTAITKEFAVIQGPPGTGKTFIGVKLVQLMLENNERKRPLWDGPIMLVCFTNHALDQFLEEIIRIYPEYVGKGLFVRIGATSKSENEELKKCFLKHIKQKRTSAACQEYRGATIRPRENMAELERYVMKISAYVEIAAKELIHPDALRPYMRHVQFKHVEHLLKWLCERKAEPGTPNLLCANAKVGGSKNQNDLENQSHLEDDYDDPEFVETEEREQNEYNLKLAEEELQAISQSVRENNEFLKLNGQKDRHLKELYQTAQSIHRRFHEAIEESDNIITVKNQWQLTLADRWRLYNYWTKCFIASKREEMHSLLKDHATEKRKLEEIQDEIDYRIFNHAKIIAMTTTGAAKRSDLLKRLAPKIVIVEEAAEVLEAHVVASLSDKCEHLILIGDHQQLKPKPTDYSLARRYRLDISLFEKVVLNKLHCDRLTIQHRMRPEIAELLVPHIYKSLENHESVSRYENVANVFGNLFFVNHSEPENSTDDNRSHSNDHEAAFLSELCRYFLNVGYDPKQITVLTTYTGQLFLLRKFMPKPEFEGVRITPVDNFQGEENDIILLSLVRSNEESNIGFLKISNRVCVALSRARKGLYIIGNGDLLRDESPLWRDILDTLKKQNKLVDSLPLGCRNHPQNVIFVKAAADFRKLHWSVCPYRCDYRLPCGHVCNKLCHELDPEHQLYKCEKPCQKLCANNMHPCRNLCFESCGNCKELVERTLSRCGHQATMCCYLKEENFKCEQPCKVECTAGHPSQQLCYRKCKCKVLVTRTLTRCQHEATMPCYLTELEYKCKKPCKKFCPFGHPCSRLCFQTCRPCEVLVTKTLSVCKHEATMHCNLSGYSFICKETCKKSCSRNHPCPKLCSEKCDVCEVPVTKILPICKHETLMPCCMEESMYLNKNLCTADVEITLPLCGHVVTRSCFASDLPLVPYKCLNSCLKSCSCGHPCERKCHEPCGVCRVMVENVLPRCNHKAMMPCYQRVDCHICQIKCNRACPAGHSCPGLCHEKCEDCQVAVEKILPRCAHRAKVPCYREPSKHRCQLPCEKNCPRGHRCPKKCGEDCGNCIYKVEKILPQCNHVNMVECYQSSSHMICNLLCEKILYCGHKCQAICGAVECTTTCKVEIEKELPCRHIAKACCHLDSNLIMCHQKIQKTLPCDHVAIIKCHQNPKTFACRQQVKKKLPCEHVAIMECSMDPLIFACLQKVRVKVCEYQYGHTMEVNCCDKETNISAFNEMMNLTRSTGLPNLTDSVQCPTSNTTYRNGCPNICDFKLECGHGCTRTCMECVAAKSHEMCNQIFSKPFSLCHHKSLCCAPLEACRNSSSYRCFHRYNTNYICTKSYEICLRFCDWNCPHYSCTAVCSQPCNRPPCNHPCRKPLGCGHICSGLCGEICLSACRKCRKIEFMERTWPNISTLSNASRFLELQPCRHFVEVVAMDVWVQENVQQLPGTLDSSCFLLCPVCSERVDFCPRYNQYIRRHELSLNTAKKLIQASGNLKRTIDEYVKLWWRTKQCKYGEMKLNDLGVNKRIKLGTLCILHEIEVMESQRKNSDNKQKCKVSLSIFQQRISEEDLYFEDKSRLAGDVIMMYKTYMDAQVRRLMTFIRGPNLRVLDKCSRLLEELECIAVSEDDFRNIWSKIDKLNRKLSMKLSPQDRKDQITDYLDHLNRFYDLQLDANFLSHWVCCRLGHVYSTNEKIDEDQIDMLCPQCHPLHNAILYFLKPEFDETAVMRKIDTAAYYKRNEIATDLSYRKTTDCSESDPLAEVVPDGNVDISGGKNNPDVPCFNLKARATPKSVHGTPEKKVVGESSFRGGHPGRRERRGNASTYDNWRTKEGSQSGKATASAFSESSSMRNSASFATANVQKTGFRGSWRAPYSDRDPENWRASADRGNSQRSTSRGGQDSQWRL